MVSNVWTGLEAFAKHVRTSQSNALLSELHVRSRWLAEGDQSRSVMDLVWDCKVDLTSNFPSLKLQMSAWLFLVTTKTVAFDLCGFHWAAFTSHFTFFLGILWVWGFGEDRFTNWRTRFEAKSIISPEESIVITLDPRSLYSPTKSPIWNFLAAISASSLLNGGMEVVISDDPENHWDLQDFSPPLSKMHNGICILHNQSSQAIFSWIGGKNSNTYIYWWRSLTSVHTSWRVRKLNHRYRMAAGKWWDISSWFKVRKLHLSRLCCLGSEKSIEFTNNYTQWTLMSY